MRLSRTCSGSDRAGRRAGIGVLLGLLLAPDMAAQSSWLLTKGAGLRVHALTGTARVSRGRTSVPLKRGDRVWPGEVIQTGDGSRVSLAPSAGKPGAPQVVTLGPKSQGAMRSSGLGMDLEYGSLHLAASSGTFMVAVGDTSCVAPDTDLVVTRVPRTGFHAVLVRSGRAACGRGAGTFVVPGGQALGVKDGTQKLAPLDDEAWHRAYRMAAFREGPTGETPGTRGLDRARGGPTMQRGVYRIPNLGNGRRSADITPTLWMKMGHSLADGWSPEVCESACRDLEWCRAWSFGGVLSGLSSTHKCVVMDHVTTPTNRRISTEATGVIRPVSHEYPKLLAQETIRRDPVVRRGVGAKAGAGFQYDLDSRVVRLSTKHAKLGTRGNPDECEAACRENPHCKLWTFQQTHQNAKGHWRGSWCRIYYREVPTGPLAHGVTGWVR